MTGVGTATVSILNKEGYVTQSLGIHPKRMQKEQLMEKLVSYGMLFEPPFPWTMPNPSIVEFFESHIEKMNKLTELLEGCQHTSWSGWKEDKFQFSEYEWDPKSDTQLIPTHQTSFDEYLQQKYTPKQPTKSSRLTQSTLSLQGKVEGDARLAEIRSYTDHMEREWKDAVHPSHFDGCPYFTNFFGKQVVRTLSHEFRSSSCRSNGPTKYHYGWFTTLHDENLWRHALSLCKSVSLPLMVVNQEVFERGMMATVVQWAIKQKNAMIIFRGSENLFRADHTCALAKEFFISLDEASKCNVAQKRDIFIWFTGSIILARKTQMFHEIYEAVLPHNRMVYTSPGKAARAFIIARRLETLYSSNLNQSCKTPLDFRKLFTKHSSELEDMVNITRLLPKYTITKHLEQAMEWWLAEARIDTHSNQVPNLSVFSWYMKEYCDLTKTQQEVNALERTMFEADKKMLHPHAMSVFVWNQRFNQRVVAPNPSSATPPVSRAKSSPATPRLTVKNRSVQKIIQKSKHERKRNITIAQKTPAFKI